MKQKPLESLLTEKTFQLLWTTAYFRVLPLPLSELDSDYLDFFFRFANTYTEESVLNGYIKQHSQKEADRAALKELGYSDKDML